MADPLPRFVETVRADGGLIFLSHIEERPDHPMTGLDGMEIYNRHADAKKDAAGLLAFLLKLTSPALLRGARAIAAGLPRRAVRRTGRIPGRLSCQVGPGDAVTRRLTGVAANDCHHNMVMIAKMVSPESVRLGTIVDKDDDMRPVSALLRPGIRELTRGHQPGDVVARLDLDPYHRSFRNVSTHILAPELTRTGDPRGASPGTRLCLPRLDVRPVRFPVRLGAPERCQCVPSPQGMGDEVKLWLGREARRPISRPLPHPADQERPG